MRKLFAPILALAGALGVVAAFLANWSFLDGAPRNSLGMFLDGTAERPFAYRKLAPTAVKTVGEILPAPVHRFLADSIAPFFQKHVVAPLLPRYEPLFPGIGERAAADWHSAEYRRNYVLMAALIYLSFAGAMLLIRQSALRLQCGELSANVLMMFYALLFPTVFLNGGYFYDFTEQFFAAALLYCFIGRRWLAFAAILLLMQLNKETALLMLFFVAPLAWRSLPRRLLGGGLVLLIGCLLIMFGIRHLTSALPGQANEWNLIENLRFWASVDAWTATADIYAVGLPIPRMSFVVCSLAGLAYAFGRGASRYAIAAALSYASLAMLMLAMGYRDEFRAAALAVPFLLAALAAQLGAQPLTQRRL